MNTNVPITGKSEVPAAPQVDVIKLWCEDNGGIFNPETNEGVWKKDTDSGEWFKEEDGFRIYLAVFGGKSELKGLFYSDIRYTTMAKACERLGDTVALDLLNQTCGNKLASKAKDVVGTYEDETIFKRKIAEYADAGAPLLTPEEVLEIKIGIREISLQGKMRQLPALFKQAGEARAAGNMELFAELQAQAFALMQEVQAAFAS